MLSIRLDPSNEANRLAFFRASASSSPKTYTDVVVIAHCVKDLPHLLYGISQVASVALVLCVPYSVEPQTFDALKGQYRLAVPTLSQLADPDFLVSQIEQHTATEAALAIVEIGGYYAAAISKLPERIAKRLIGIVEDTEAGHRRYQSLGDKLPVPVISVARSELKCCEDALIGPSAVFSIEKLLRQCDLHLEGRRACVIGYGKIGRGAAQALRRKNCAVSVLEIDPSRRIAALSEGFSVPSMESAFSSSDLVLGATGTRSMTRKAIDLLQHGCVVASCSSRDVEIDVPYLTGEGANSVEDVILNVTRVQRGETALYLLRSGWPVNFIDGSVTGPLIALVQAELVASLADLIRRRPTAGLHENTPQMRKEIAELWLQHFVNAESGGYLHASA